jgi:DeoR/GlpR family transcriptional regulator of sugar metabolism
MVGPLAVKAFSELHADVAVMGAGGITLDGLSNSHALLIDIQRAMLKSAAKVVFCLDNSKFGRKSVAFLCGLELAPTIITDPAAPAGLIEELRGKGLQVLQASEDGKLAEATLMPAAAGSSETDVSAPTSPEPSEAEAPASLVGWD